MIIISLFKEGSATTYSVFYLTALYSRSNLNLEVLVSRGGENRSTRRKTSRSKEENQQQTTSSPGIEPRVTSRWEGSALTTIPSLLPSILKSVSREA